MKNIKMRLLVLRTSAMGDVALLTPVLRSLVSEYLDVEVTLVTRAPFAFFFNSIPRIALFHPDFKKRHSGIRGIYRLYKDLSKINKYDYVIDLHDVLRTRVLNLFFRAGGTRVKIIDKERKEKKRIITGRKRNFLKHSVDRYAEVFFRAGLSLPNIKGPWIVPSEAGQKRAAAFLTETNLIHIGVAPYAKHELKTWPEENMIRLLGMIAEKNKVRFWLFGGKEETAQLLSFQNKVPESILVAGTLNLDEELALMSRLKLMIAMDSSNMHMAALLGTTTVSIWGGTDPVIGFGAWQQPDDQAIRIPAEELSCRPCTVYGKGSCKRGDFACMKWLTPVKVYQRLVELKVI